MVKDSLIAGRQRAAGFPILVMGKPGHRRQQVRTEEVFGPFARHQALQNGLECLSNDVVGVAEVVNVFASHRGGDGDVPSVQPVIGIQVPATDHGDELTVAGSVGR